ncbi:MAG: BON domain-containing protein [Comamonadaceae bacterium]|nr:MAG: BON domain-containing protein [Comamonadaceae bacterium]
MNKNQLARSVPRLALALLAGATLVGGLAGCVPLVVGAAAAGGIGMVATDRRTSGAQLDDEGIELRAAARVREISGEGFHVNITSFNRQVLLTGEVPSAAARQRVEDIAARVDNVASVVNDLAVAPTSSLPQRSNDSYITGKVKASLLDAKDVFANAYKVVTERNVVYIMGRVTRREADRAADIARGVGGVEKVVRVMEVVSEAELAGQVRAGTSSGSNAPATPYVPAPASSSSPAPSSGSSVPLPPMAPLSPAVSTPVR